MILNPLHFTNTRTPTYLSRAKQGREEEANKYRERVEAIEEILLEHDRQEQERAAGLRKSYAEVDWRNPSESMRKVCHAYIVWLRVQTYRHICTRLWVAVFRFDTT